MSPDRPTRSGFASHARRLLTAGIAAIAIAACGSGGGGGESTGDALAKLAVTSVADDSSTDLTSLADGPLVINVWAPWCPPCRQEMPDIEAAAEAHRDDVTVVGLATGSEPQAVRDFVAEIGAGYPMYLDTDEAALDRLDIVSMPTTLFVDGDGHIVQRVSGRITPSQLEEGIAAISG